MNEQQQLAFRKLKHSVEVLRLGNFDPVLRDMIGRVRPEANNPIHDLLLPRIQQRYDALAKDHETTGLVNVPPAFLPTGFVVAQQEGTDALVSVCKEGNTIYPGPPGSGKTTLQHNTMLAVKATTAKLYVIDPKEDHRFLTALYPSFITIDAHTPLNFLERPPWRTINEHIAEHVDRYQPSFYSGAQQGAAFRKAFTNSYSVTDRPCCADVHNIVDKLAQKSDPYSWREACTGVSERFHKIKQRYPVGYATRDGIPLPSLLDTDIYHPLHSTDTVGEWVATGLLSHIFQRNKTYGTRHLTTAAFIDEGIGLLNKAKDGRIAGNPLATLATINREFGLWLCFTTVDLNETDPLILSTAATIALLPGVREQSLRLAGLTPLQAQTARHMRRGQVLFVYPGRLAWPLMARFNPLPDGLKERRPPVPEPERTLAAPQLVNYQPQGPAPVALPVEPPKGVGLNESELGIMRALHAKDGIAATTETYDDAGLHYSIGDAAKQKLLKLGFITAAKIVAHGRTGGTVQAMQLTTLGSARLGLTPPRRTRGGGPQSEYLCQRLRRLIPECHLELDIAGKSIDLAFRVDHALHARFCTLLHEHGIAFGRSDTTIPQGSLCGIEIEASTDSSNFVRSVSNNSEKNADAGIDVLVFGVMSKMVARAKKHLAAQDHKIAVVLIDVFKLLDGLRKEQRHG